MAYQGMWAAVLVAAVTAAFTIIFISLGVDNATALPASAWNFIDVGLFVAIALFIRKLSRAAAVCGLLLYWLEQIYAFASVGLESGQVVGIWMIVLLSCAFINGIRGTWAYHRFSQS